jgi:hypothetical protein
MIMLALGLLCMITRIWPLLFLVIPGIIIAALRLLFLSAKKESDNEAPAVSAPVPRPETGRDVISIAFGFLQKRITHEIISRYPNARWVWEAPNAIERFAENLPLTILLNSAGGYRKASVRVSNLQFCGLVFVTAQATEPPPEIDFDGDTGSVGAPDDGSVDYALIAFQWVEANLLDLNNRCNDAIADGQAAMLIPARDLPHPDSWDAVCVELTRNGFSEAVAMENGISAMIPKN